ncbi:helix-turn-helix domain-containing protein [Microbacterium aerolatum]|uniref:helix-turn-helix domain-containing protein n=1 Tax=Microbacterium aerolatum TaxID=153731 RepID=UPI00384E4DEA
MSYLSTDEAAQQLGVTPRRVVQLLNQHALDGHQVQRDWLVSASSVRQRQALTAARGRPMTSQTARSLIDALDRDARLPARRADLVRNRDAELLSSAIAHSVVIDTYMTRDPESASERLHLTGESALDRITSLPGEALIGTVREVHGYLQSTSLEELIDDAMLVRSDEGTVHIYRFRDDEFPWAEIPATLIAVDAARSMNSRVRAAGLEALDRKRTRWLARHTR